ncbi:MAG TPA: PAS domain S-box protein [Gaiella sp.]|nr:PAS domain S-box protein [Gaiella sp.]
MSRRRLALAVILGALLYTGAVVLVAIADLENARLAIVIAVLAGLSFTIAGAFAAATRPENRTGAQMLAVGLLWSLGALQVTNGSLPFTIGYLLSGLAFVAFAHLILSYPTGELRPGDRWLVWGVLAVVTVGPLLVTLFDPTPIPTCDTCPQNAFLVDDSPRLARAAGVALALAAAVVGAAFIVRLVRRYRQATPPLRRVLGPVYLVTLVSLAALVASSLIATVSASAGFVVELAALASLALIPVAFVAGVLRTRLARAGIADLAIAIGNGTPLRDALADALGDPSLQLAYWSPERERWVDDEGRTLAEPIAKGDQVATLVEQGGRRVAALIHDRMVAEQRELVEAVAATVALAFEKERLQAEVRAQYRSLETIINTAPSLLSVVDTEGRFRNFNRAVEIASGLEERSRVEGAYFWDVFISSDEREAMIERFHAAAPDFPTAEYENIFTDAKGQERVIAWRTAPLVDESGNVVRIVAGGIDITDRKRREIDLQLQRDFATTVADTIPSYIVLTDREGTVLPSGANRAFCVALGCNLDALVGTSVLELVHPEDEPSARAAIAAAATGLAQLERESRWLARDGRELVVAWTATPILDEHGTARVLVSGMDVSERTRQAEELRASRSRIVAATDAARRRLERNLHDGAQQRLAALSLSLRLAEARLPDDPEQAAELLKAARDELARALDELRELARGLHPNVLTDRGLGPALESLVLRSPFPVDVDVPEERLAPPIEAAAYYVAAEALANVAKYAHADEAHVRIVDDPARDEVLVEVSDNGIGGADPSRGSGLKGLEDRVEALDGRLEVDSPPGGGTRIRARIPRARRVVPF